MKRILFLSLIIAGKAHAFFLGCGIPEGIEGPWFTGPLLTPNGKVIPVGHYNVEPFIFLQEKYGTYDSTWNVKKSSHRRTLNYLLSLQVGITEWMDISLSPQMFQIRENGVESGGVGDTSFGPEIQLLKERGWLPDIKFIASMLFPTGKYERLDPQKYNTDARGDGAYQGIIGVVFQKTRYFGSNHFFRSRFYIEGVFPTNVHVHGLNSYGGDLTTKGTVHTGNHLNILTGFEYSVTRNWVLASDIVFNYAQRNTFSGRTVKGVGNPESYQLSFTPSIEYNWSGNLGLIAGAWFTGIGKNSSAFYGGAIALNYYH